MEESRIKYLEVVASEIRKDIVKMVGVARSGPLDLPLALSDLLVYLYWEELVVLPAHSSREDRDRLLVGVEDAAPAVYAVLAARGFFDREELWHYRRLGAMLQSTPDYKRTPGIDAPCLNSGEIAIASSLAQAVRKIDSKPRVFCLALLSECSENNFIDEVKRSASQNLSNLYLLLLCDARAEDFSETIVKRSNELKAEGWNVFTADGKDFVSMENVFASAEQNSERPVAFFMLLYTAKGFSFIDAVQSKNPGSMSMGDMDQALEELEGNINDQQ